MRALVIEHDAFSPIGPVGDRLRRHGFDVEELVVVPPERHEDPGVEITFPEPSGWDLIVAMGAPWSVDEAAIGGWISAELALLREAQRIGVPVLGICFGGQALAAALGGEISLAEPPAVGWFETETSEPGLVSSGPWLHFNSERFAVPDGATLVASLGESASAFRLGPHLGLQFHPEATPALAGRWGDHYTEWLAEHGLLTPAGIREQASAQAGEIGPRAFTLFDAWWAGVRAPA